MKLGVFVVPVVYLEKGCLKFFKNFVNSDCVMDSIHMICLWTHGGHICNVKSTCLIRTIFEFASKS